MAHPISLEKVLSVLEKDAEVFTEATLRVASSIQVIITESYLVMDPLGSGLAICVIAAFSCWLGSIVSGNSSQVDRLWSIIPAVYALHFALHDTFLNQLNLKLDARLTLMAILALAWGTRLTYNFARKGGYNPREEDYRWPTLRKIFNNVFLYQIFNIVFIAGYQNLLLYLITLPCYVAYLFRGTPLNILDYVAFGLFTLFLIGESIADQQQWSFQTEKYRRINDKLPLDGDYKRGFCTSGLFKYSRHPNFFFEFSQWYAFYLFSVAASGEILNWSLVGAVLLHLLFFGSTAFTEWITSKKYPDYLIYQRSVSALFPSPFSKVPTWNGQKKQK